MKREENIRKPEDQRPETGDRRPKFRVQSLKNTECVTCNPEPATIKRNSTGFYNKIPLRGYFRYWQLVLAGAVFNN